MVVTRGPFIGGTRRTDTHTTTKNGEIQYKSGQYEWPESLSSTSTEKNKKQQRLCQQTREKQKL